MERSRRDAIMTDTAQQTGSENTDKSNLSRLNRIIKRFGGRHLIFRTKTGGWWFTPTPYVLISSFRGPVWVFYGAGQVWLTHKKLREVGGWMARVPRFASTKVVNIVDNLESDLAAFTHFCNEHGIEGTIVVETKVIEFHWTFGDELDHEKHKKENAKALDAHFQALCDRYLEVTSETDG